MANRLRVTFTTKGLMESMNLSRRKVQRAREAFDEAVKNTLADIATENFNKLSSGASGATGRKWKRIKPETIRRKGRNQIGVDTGALRDSLKATVTNRGITIQYQSPYAGYFDEERPLLPDSLPMTWEAKLEKAGQKAIVNVLGR